MVESFADRLDAAMAAKKSCLVVGLDPVLDRLPPALLMPGAGQTGGWGRGDGAPLGRIDPSLPGFTGRASALIALWLRRLLEAVAPHAVAVKPNAGFFERFGAAGFDALRSVCESARRLDLLVILDAKRGDIGSTAEAYADGLLGDTPDTVGPLADAITLNPWLGRDSVEPFLERARDAGKGLFFLVRTSNPSAAEFQELEVDGEPLYVHVARRVAEWGAGLDGRSGLNPIGAVVGATAPAQAARVREVLPNSLFLVPGYGAQGGGADGLRACFCEGGRGVVVNASRSILYAHEKQPELEWHEAVERAAREAKEELEGVRGS